MIRLDNGRIGGCWITVNNKTYTLACTKEHGQGQGRIHHVTYASDTREGILRAADIFLENGVHIKTGPHKHAIGVLSSFISGNLRAPSWSSLTQARG